MICKVQGVPIYYEKRGEGCPFLALHGGGRDHEHMAALLEPLFAAHPGWRRIYPDLPGHGRTPAPEWLTHHDQVLGLLLDFIDRVVPGAAFALAGLSRGGYLARGLLAKRPETIVGILLIIPAINRAACGVLPDKVVLVKDEGALADLTPYEGGFLDGYVVQDRTALEDIRQGLPGIERADRSFQELILRPENYDLSIDVERTPAAYDKPALVLAGRQDALMGYTAALRTVEQFTRGTLVVLDRAGHALPAEQNTLFLVLAEEWLRRVEESLGQKPKTANNGIDQR